MCATTSGPAYALAISPTLAEPDYDTSYLAHRQVLRDCLVHYRGSRYSVPHRYVGQAVAVREPLDGARLRIYYQEELLADHPLSRQPGATLSDPQHFVGLWPKRRVSPAPTPQGVRLPAGPGIGLERVAPWVEKRSLRVYEHVVQGGR